MLCVDKNLYDISSGNKAKNILTVGYTRGDFNKTNIFFFFFQTGGIYNVADKPVCILCHHPATQTSICKCVCLRAGINRIQTSITDDPEWVNARSPSCNNDIYHGGAQQLKHAI